METPHSLGFLVAAAEISAGIASFASAEERGLFPSDSMVREDWDRGYEDCVCAHRLGHDVREMARSGVHGPSLLSTPAVVAGLLDATWPNLLRPDPRA